MKKVLLLGMMALAAMSSCKDENDAFDDKGSASVIAFDGPASAYMGDSISYTFEVRAGGQKLNQSKVQLYYGTEMVSEAFYVTGENGKYTARIAVPFLKDVDDQTATVKLRIQNERFETDTQTRELTVSRPQYDKLVLEMENGTTYDMLPVPGKPNRYSVKGAFNYEEKGIIRLPKYGENGYEILFGMTDGRLTKDSNGEISFEGEKDSEGNYEIWFNTKTFQGGPFIKFAIYFPEDELEEGAEERTAEFEGSGTSFSVDTELKQNEAIQIKGLRTEYADYWINPTYFDKVKGTDGETLRFRGMTGKYRVTVDKSGKYFSVITLVNGQEGTASSRKNAEAMWVNGNGGIGFPSYSTNAINWNTGRAVCLMPIAPGVHQLVMEGGRNLNVNSVDYKFYGGRNWQNEYNASYIALGDGSPYFVVNGSDGNIKAGSQKPVAGKFYRITIDTTGSDKAQMSVVELDEIEEVD